MFMYSY